MEITKLFEIPENQLKKNPLDAALAGKENGSWRKYSTQEYIDIANNIAYGLINLGVKKDDKVAIISINRPEWNIVDQGIMRAGAIPVPLYPTISDSDYAYIFNDSQIKYVFVGDSDIEAKSLAAQKSAPSVQQVYSFDNLANSKDWKEVIENGKSNPQKEKAEARQAAVVPTELATIIYTSGTTGVPKGVMLSHSNLLSNIEATIPLCPMKANDQVLSFLPLCHVYERMLTFFYQTVGVSIYYAESMETIGDNLKEVKPVMFSTVPRLLEKVFDKIVAKGSELGFPKKQLFNWALNLGLKFEHDGANGAFYEFQLKLANKIIFSKWREALGGNIQLIASGSAALQTRLMRVFWAAQIPITEGYGLSETSPVITVNRLTKGDKMIGTVGPVIDGVEVKIGSDGEILCKGPNVMLGYYKKPDKTAEEFTEDGWLKTGDVGEFVEGKFLKLTDRKKEMFKTSGGKFIAPQLLENKYKESSFIEQIMIVGEDRRFPGALIVPNQAHLTNWAKIVHIEHNDYKHLCTLDVVKERVMKEIEDQNANFGKYEQVKEIRLLPDEWGVESGELTPTLKLKRKIITQKYQNQINDIYANKEIDDEDI